MSPLLSAAAVLMIAAAIRELGSQRTAPSVESRRRIARRFDQMVLVDRLGVGRQAALRRITAAGLAGQISADALIAARVICALVSIPPALLLAPALPGRLAVIAALGIPIAVSLLPDALIDRLASRRRARIAAALPEALDLMAVGATAGGGAQRLLADAVRGAAGPLRAELAQAVAEIECGRSQQQVLRGLRRAGGGPGLASLAAALERSARYGAPLASGLGEQSRSLRQEQSRRIGEGAAKAAPKIQLVVALLLVPSVLLIVAAAILAGSDSLLTVL